MKLKCEVRVNYTKDKTVLSGQIETWSKEDIISEAIIQINKESSAELNFSPFITLCHEVGHLLTYTKMIKDSDDIVKLSENNSIINELGAWSYAYKLYALLKHKLPDKSFYSQIDTALKTYFINNYDKSYFRGLR